MKIKIAGKYEGPCLPLNAELLRVLRAKVGDIVEIDVPMVGDGLTIRPLEQRTGVEVV